jgi:hypothetical protein
MTACAVVSRFQPLCPTGCAATVFCAVDFAQIAVERAERQVSSLAWRFEKEAIGEPKGWSRPEGLECRGHDIAALEDQMVVVQELLDRRANRCRITLVDSGQHPYRLGEREERNRRARCHEFVGRANLPGIVAGQNAHQDVRVNGAHALSDVLADPVLQFFRCPTLRAISSNWRASHASLDDDVRAPDARCRPRCRHSDTGPTEPDEPWIRCKRQPAAPRARDRARVELRRIEGAALYAARSARDGERPAGSERCGVEGAPRRNHQGVQNRNLWPCSRKRAEGNLADRRHRSERARRHGRDEAVGWNYRQRAGRSTDERHAVHAVVCKGARAGHPVDQFRRRSPVESRRYAPSRWRPGGSGIRVR